MKIVALSVPFPGAKRPLEEGAKLGFWDFVLLDGKIEIPPADLYLLGAWHPIYEHILSAPADKAVLWTSSVGEMDFTPVERGYLRGLLDDTRISFLWFGCHALGAAHEPKGFGAPYPFAVPENEAGLPGIAEKKDIITLFCPTGPKKNILNQLYALRLAATKYGIDFTLHTNIAGYDQELRAIPKVVRHGWLDRPAYEALIASARLNMALSWAETYSYQAVEAALMGTPSLASPSIRIPVMGDALKLKLDCHLDLNDPTAIAQAVRSVWSDLSQQKSLDWEDAQHDTYAAIDWANDYFRSTWSAELKKRGYELHDGQRRSE